MRLGWEDIFYSFLLTSYLFLYRTNWFGFDQWSFYKMQLWPSVAYIDCLLFLPFILLGYLLIPQSRNSKTQEDIKFKLLEDSPISSSRLDQLNRNEFAEFVANHIVNNSSSSSFAIGINAKWGDGKTSFQNLVGNHIRIKEPDAIIFVFNPWKSIDEKKIVNDFFELFSDTVRVLDFRLSKMLSTYGRKLLDKSNSWWSSLLQQIFYPNENVENQFIAINQLLEKSDRRIVIFVDDLDRLSTEEIMEVVKLIRNSASFRNTFFVVGYDQEYIKDALKKHNKYGKDNFLEKIFQMQIDLHHIPPSVIVQNLKKSLNILLPDFSDQIDAISGYRSKSKSFLTLDGQEQLSPSDFITQFLDNLRDVKRFASFFAINFKQVSTEVEFEEYFIVCLIRFKYPALVRKLNEHGKHFFDYDFINGTRKFSSENGLKKILTKIPKRQSKAIVHIFRSLFDESKTKRSRKSIIYSENFQIYFSNRLDNKGILLKEFVPVFNKPWSEIEEHIELWLKEGKEGYLIDNLGEIDALESKERFEKVTFIRVLLVNRGIRAEYILGQWIQSITANRSKVEELFGSDKSFFEALFMPSSDPFFYDTYAIRPLLRSYIDKSENFYFPLTKEELQRIAVKRLLGFINSRNEFDIRVFNLFYYNCWSGKTTSNNVLIADLANRLIRRYIDKFPTDYLRFVIRSRNTPHFDNEFVFEPFAHQYFGSWEKFESFLIDSINRHSEFIDIHDYFQKFKSNRYEYFVADSIPWIEADVNGNSVLKYFKGQTIEDFTTQMDLYRKRLKD